MINFPQLPMPPWNLKICTLSVTLTTSMCLFRVIFFLLFWVKGTSYTRAMASLWLSGQYSVILTKVLHQDIFPPSQIQLIRLCLTTGDLHFWASTYYFFGLVYFLLLKFLHKLYSHQNRAATFQIVCHTLFILL